MRPTDQTSVDHLGLFHGRLCDCPWPSDGSMAALEDTPAAIDFGKRYVKSSF